MQSQSQNLVDRFAASGLSWEVQEPQKWSFFGSFLESKPVSQTWKVWVSRGEERILELECSTDPRRENKLEVAMTEHRNPRFEGCKATKVAVSRYLKIGTQNLNREQSAPIFEALNIFETEEEEATEVVVNLPIPGWVGAMGDYPHSIRIPVGKALNEVEDFLLALPPELLPKWVKLPDQFGNHFQRWMGNALWPDWAWLEGVEVFYSSSGKPSVNVRREADWVPLNLGTEMPKVARDGFLKLAEVGAAGGAVPSWARGSQEAWTLLRDELLKK